MPWPQKQMKGPGGMISFELAGGLPASTAFLKALRVFVCAESLGGVESRSPSTRRS